MKHYAQRNRLYRTKTKRDTKLRTAYLKLHSAEIKALFDRIKYLLLK